MQGGGGGGQDGHMLDQQCGTITMAHNAGSFPFAIGRTVANVLFVSGLHIDVCAHMHSTCAVVWPQLLNGGCDVPWRPVASCVISGDYFPVKDHSRCL